MSVEHCTSKYLVLVLSGLALTACSPKASTAVPASASVQVAAAAATSTPLVTGLPDFTALVEQFGPAVVNVKVTEKRQPRGGGDSAAELLRQFGLPVPGIPEGNGRPRGQPQQGEGSGFIVSTDGYILTNRHVVLDASEVVVKLTDRREFKAKVIGMDEKTDVAVIKIEGTNLPTVRIGDPSKLRPGQWVVAIGSPFGMDNSVTSGIVSATSRRLPDETFVPFIQTDVAVNPGNSGGPLFNLNGEVVGINSQIYSQSGGYMGLSFAIPIDIANDVRDQLVKTGKVTRGRLGVAFQTVTAETAESWGLDRPRGALVSDVVVGEAAEKAGIKPGDIVLSVGGKAVDSDIALPAMVAAIRPGTSTEIELWRDSKVRKVVVKVGEAKDEVASVTGPAERGNERGGSAVPAPDALGLSVRPITSEEKQEAKTAGSLVVEAVTGAAERAGLERGDIILGVQGQAVKSVAELQAAAAKGGKAVSLRVQRGDNIQYVVVRRE